MKLVGEGEYNLNILKEIKVTDSYLGLDPSIKGCQNTETLEKCTTRYYIDNLIAQCKCVPFNMGQMARVHFDNCCKIFFSTLFSGTYMSAKPT